MRKKWVVPSIEKYLSDYYKETDTKDTIRAYLHTFFTTMNEKPDTFLKKPKNKISEIVLNYIKKIDGRCNKTQTAMISSIKKYLERNGIKNIAWETFIIRNGLTRARATVRKKTPDQRDIKYILSYATGIKSKTLFTLLASSGLRINEALGLEWNDIDMDNRMIDVREEIAKNHIWRITFFTPETKDLLLAWKSEREKMLTRSYRKSVFLREKLEKNGYEVLRVKDCVKHGEQQYRYEIRKDGRALNKEEIIAIDNRVFPFDYTMSAAMWGSLLEKAGSPYNEKDNNSKLKKGPRYSYNLHSLRRFYLVQTTLDRGDPEFFNFMSGHTSELTVGYKWTQDAVTDETKRELRDEYNKHLKALSIMEIPPDLSGITEDMKAKDEIIQKMQQQINELNEFKSKYLEQLVLKHETQINGKKRTKKP